MYAYRDTEMAEFTEIFNTEATEATEALQRGPAFGRREIETQPRIASAS